MMCIYRVTLAIVLTATTQVSMAAFPDDLYGFKLGDSLSATQSKFKNKYGKVIVLGEGSSVVQRKCGLGFIGTNHDLNIDNDTEIELHFNNFKLTFAQVAKKNSLYTKEEVKSYLNDLMSKYGQPLDIEKYEDGSFSNIRYKNANMFADLEKVQFSIYNADYEDEMNAISKKCINKSIRNDLP